MSALKKKLRQIRTSLTSPFSFRSTIYSRVVLIITLLSLILFVSFGIIFRSVYERYMSAVIRDNGSNIGTIVQGALYHSMLVNDKSSLQNTMNVINTTSGIENVYLYDKDYYLAYSSNGLRVEEEDSDCMNCHEADMHTLFPEKIKSFTIISEKSACEMSNTLVNERYLLINSPILNQEACYNNACHAHEPTESVLGSLIIKVPMKNFDKAVAQSNYQFYILATLTTLLLVTLLIFFTRKQIMRPLNALRRTSEAVTEGNLDTRVEISPDLTEDMRTVSLTFNNMLDNLQVASEELENWSQQLEYKVQKKTEELGAAHNELVHVERMASLGKLSSSVAHEINNPLSGILVYTKLIQKQLSNPELNEAKKESAIKNLKLIESETKRCGDIVRSLLDFSRESEEDFEVRNLHDILNESFDLMAHTMKISNIKFTKDFSATNDRVLCSSNKIKQVCIALLTNAAEAITENGAIQIKTYNPNDESIKIEITDNGIGIPEQIVQYIFEPFFSTKQSSSGIGLGLSIVHGILQNHKARIRVDSTPGKGTSFIITMPLVLS